MSAPSRMPSLSYSCLVIRSFRSIARKSESLAPFVRDSSLSSSRNGSEVLQGTLRFRAAAQGAAHVGAHPAGGRAVGPRRSDGRDGPVVPAQDPLAHRSVRCGVRSGCRGVLLLPRLPRPGLPPAELHLPSAPAGARSLGKGVPRLLH